jgi:hypothetical protein
MVVSRQSSVLSRQLSELRLSTENREPKKSTAAGRKPNSVPLRETIIPLVPALLTGSSDLPGDFGRAVLKRLPIWSCSVRGFACHLPYDRRGALLPHLFTLTRLRPCGRRRAVYFLCHFPSGHPDRALPGALPLGVRTFLPAVAPCGAPARRSSGRLRYRTISDCTLTVSFLTDRVLLELLVEVAAGRADHLGGLRDIPAVLTQFFDQPGALGRLLELAQRARICTGA